MCSAPNVYMFVYILIGTHMVPLSCCFHTFVLCAFGNGDSVNKTFPAHASTVGTPGYIKD